ncbi:hypothetical protein D918_02302 [Trichuris suis]|nr:hypothetical protein D918_02302 [Trichuris suis]
MEFAGKESFVDCVDIKENYAFIKLCRYYQKLTHANFKATTALREVAELLWRPDDSAQAKFLCHQKRYSSSSWLVFYLFVPFFFVFVHRGFPFTKKMQKEETTVNKNEGRWYKKQEEDTSHGEEKQLKRKRIIPKTYMELLLPIPIFTIDLVDNGLEKHGSRTLQVIEWQEILMYIKGELDRRRTDGSVFSLRESLPPFQT